MSQRLRNLILGWLGIQQALSRINASINQVDRKTESALQLIKERTEAGIDIHHLGRGGHYVVCVGKYKGVDYVEAFEVPNATFEQTIQECRRIQKTMNLRYMDTHPTFRAVLKKELE